MNKTAVITGATSGIGKAISEVLIRNKINVLMNGRSFSDTIEINEIIQTKFDLLEENAPQELLNIAVNKFGQVDYLFVAAGIIRYKYTDNLLRTWIGSNKSS